MEVTVALEARYAIAPDGCMVAILDDTGVLAVVLTKVRGRRKTAVAFTFVGGAIPVVQQQGQFQRS
jgi:hypothetical protein